MFRPRRQYVIGDIHGHYKELQALYQKLLVEGPLDPTQDQVIFLGDLIDVGPDSKLVIEQCMQWEQQFNTEEDKHFVFLYGNHEDLLIDALNPTHPEYGEASVWYRNGGTETIKSYLKKDTQAEFKKAVANPANYLPKEHVEWLSLLPYFFITSDYIFVHGGLPDQPLDQIYTRAQQNDKALFHDMIWLRDEFIYSTFNWGRTIIFGHTASPTLEPIHTPNKIGLNTMPRNEGKLTALEIPSMRFIFQPKL